jgi:hypothetical protein
MEKYSPNGSKIIINFRNYNLLDDPGALLSVLFKELPFLSVVME